MYLDDAENDLKQWVLEAEEKYLGIEAPGNLS